MPVIKRKTIGDDTLVLKRAKTNKTGKQFEYFVAEQGGAPIGDPVYTKEEGVEKFRETVSAYDRRLSEQKQSGGRGGPPGIGGGFMGGGGGGGGFFGGGHDDGDSNDGDHHGPVGVGTGFFNTDEDDDGDDDGPQFPFL